MKTENFKLTGVLLAGLVCALPPVAAAAAQENPYGLIGQRNSFRLLPVPKVPSDAPRPFAKLTLQGTTTVLGRRLALLKMIPPGNTSEANREVSVILGEGDVAGSVEVLEINESARTVRVLNHGTPQALSL